MLTLVWLRVMAWWQLDYSPEERDGNGNMMLQPPLWHTTWRTLIGLIEFHCVWPWLHMKAKSGRLFACHSKISFSQVSWVVTATNVMTSLCALSVSLCTFCSIFLLRWYPSLMEWHATRDPEKNYLQRTLRNCRGAENCCSLAIDILQFFFYVSFLCQIWAALTS